MSNLESSQEKNNIIIQDLKLEINQLKEKIENKNKYIKERNSIIDRLEHDKENIISNFKEKNYIFENESKEEKVKFNIELERLQAEYARRKQYLEIETKKVKEEKLRYTKEYQENLKTTSSEFVKETVKDLEAREKKLSKYANWWSISGAAVLAIGLILTIIISFWNSFGISPNMS
ncbi:hypothetical protein AA103196_1217 [Ameyamaea chiangmaiensis NBRC 103196]|uniref:Uncharacterized protein n=1 Tax=Ameyamaea chiangmaiensis TaxID=442969 RepID=A0A850PGP2_9PROT|nr:hypothetical protein [Ameyamaea chiangmaiensis]MBS4075016.1 hypothetical protein [Ameyamaea chiangmaiensis]NVN41819.1 hypothetical protein [Ameyamaea chiangmaiensis]GBQ65773.1 hypothetical protein AA103196_1217 [Ameyamaea chiangmaiensis NBRC 103196]